MIKANFNSYASYVTDSLYQWDINQVLTVSGLNLDVAPEIHFSNSNMDRAIVRQATLDKLIVSVNIPNSLLQEALTIKAHIGIYEGDTFKVVELIEIPVIAKTRPSDYKIENTDEEIYSFEALKNDIANMVTLADYNANNSSVSASISKVNSDLTARIDNIIAHNNETEGNTELVDIRTDHRGNVWESAGKAVRETLTRVCNGQWLDNNSISSSKLVNNFNYRGAKDRGNLDEFTDDGSYLLNGVFENSPFDDNTPFILINNTLLTNSPRTFQMAISYHNNDVIYWRVVSSANGGESWHDLNSNTIMRRRGAIDNTGESLTEYLDDGSYMFSYGHTINDTPFGKNAFILLNIVGTNNYIIQIISNLSTPQTVYSRIYKNGTTTDWRLLTPNEITDSPLIVNFGDSIFGQNQNNNSISYRLSTLLNATVINAGLGGTTLEPWDDGLSQYFSMKDIADAIVSKEWTTLETQAKVSEVDYFSNTISTLKNIDFSTVDHITINHGTNDWSRGAIIENEDNLEDTSTYKGALRYIINKLQSTYPNAKISIVSVINRFDSGDGRSMKNANGNTLEDFANASKEVCRELFVNYINVFDNLGFNNNTKNYYFGDSTVHPNENGNNIIANHIAKNL
jgi:lysophospholipase L1-like esterase